ncbi:MAG: hypothetical protein ACOVOR_04470 [Rhabdochlamydiaceae bacterium]
MRMHHKIDPLIDCKKWQVEDYRLLAEEEIFSRLQLLGIAISKKTFFEYAGHADNPEELADMLWVNDDDMEGYDQAYLNLFELWRRYFVDTPSLSIFCDELDTKIEKYVRQGIRSIDLEPILKDLVDILDENVADGYDHQEIFKEVASHVAHNIEDFLFDYISTCLDEEDVLYGSALIDDFYEYVEDQIWFDFLKARAMYHVDKHQGSFLLLKIIENTSVNDADIDLEVLSFAHLEEDKNLFLTVALELIDKLKEAQDMIDLLELLSLFFQKLYKQDISIYFDSLMKLVQKEEDLSFGEREKIRHILHQEQRNHIDSID